MSYQPTFADKLAAGFFVVFDQILDIPRRPAANQTASEDTRGDRAELEDLRETLAKVQADEANFIKQALLTIRALDGEEATES